jgi:hypothetical protein
MKPVSPRSGYQGSSSGAGGNGSGMNGGDTMGGTRNSHASSAAVSPTNKRSVAPSSRSPRTQKAIQASTSSASSISTLSVETDLAGRLKANSLSGNSPKAKVGYKQNVSPTKLADFSVEDEMDILWPQLIVKLRLANKLYSSNTNIRIPDSVFYCKDFSSPIWLYTDDNGRICIRRDFKDDDVLSRFNNGPAVKLQEQSGLRPNRIISAVIVGKSSLSYQKLTRDELQSTLQEKIDILTQSRVFLQSYRLPFGYDEVLICSYAANLPAINDEYGLRSAALGANVEFCVRSSTGIRKLQKSDESAQLAVFSIRELVQHVWMEQHCFVRRIVAEFILDINGILWITDIPIIQGNVIIPKFGVPDPLFELSEFTRMDVVGPIDLSAVCRDCETDNNGSSKFCWNCGSSMSAQNSPSKSAPVPSTRRKVTSDLLNKLRQNRRELVPVASYIGCVFEARVGSHEQNQVESGTVVSISDDDTIVASIQIPNQAVKEYFPMSQYFWLDLQLDLFVTVAVIKKAERIAAVYSTDSLTIANDLERDSSVDSKNFIQENDMFLARSRLLPKSEEVDRWYLDQCLFCFSDNFLDVATKSPREDLLGKMDSNIWFDGHRDTNEMHDMENGNIIASPAIIVYNWLELLPKFKLFQLPGFLNCVVKNTNGDSFTSYVSVGTSVTSQNIDKYDGSRKTPSATGDPRYMYLASQDGKLLSRLDRDEYTAMLSSNSNLIWKGGQYLLLDIPFLLLNGSAFEQRRCTVEYGEFQEYKSIYRIDDNFQINEVVSTIMQPTMKGKQLMSGFIQSLEALTGSSIRSIIADFILDSVGNYWMFCVPYTVCEMHRSPINVSLSGNNAENGSGIGVEWLELLNCLADDGRVSVPLLNCCISSSGPFVGYSNLPNGYIGKRILGSLTDTRSFLRTTTFDSNQETEMLSVCATDYSCGALCSPYEFWEPLLNAENSVELLPTHVVIQSWCGVTEQILRVVYSQETLMGYWSSIFAPDSATLGATFSPLGEWSEPWTKVKRCINEFKQFGKRSGQQIASLEVLFSIDESKNVWLVCVKAIKTVSHDSRLHEASPGRFNYRLSANDSFRRGSYYSYCTSFPRKRLLWADLLQSVLAGKDIPVCCMWYLSQDTSFSERGQDAIVYHSSVDRDSYFAVEENILDSSNLDNLMTQIPGSAAVAVMLSVGGDPVLLLDKAEVSKSIIAQTRGPASDDDFAIQQVCFSKDSSVILQLTCHFTCTPVLVSSTTSEEAVTYLISAQLFSMRSGSRLVKLERQHSDAIKYYVQTYSAKTRLRHYQLMRDTATIIGRCVRNKLGSTIRVMKAKFYLDSDDNICLANVAYAVTEVHKEPLNRRGRNFLDSTASLDTSSFDLNDSSDVLPTVTKASVSAEFAKLRSTGGVQGHIVNFPHVQGISAGAGQYRPLQTISSVEVSPEASMEGFPSVDTDMKVEDFESDTHINFHSAGLSTDKASQQLPNIMRPRSSTINLLRVQRTPEHQTFISRRQSSASISSLSFLDTLSVMAKLNLTLGSSLPATAFVVRGKPLLFASDESTAIQTKKSIADISSACKSVSPVSLEAVDVLDGDFSPKVAIMVSGDNIKYLNVAQVETLLSSTPLSFGDSPSAYLQVLLSPPQDWLICEYNCVGGIIASTDIIRFGHIDRATGAMNLLTVGKDIIEEISKDNQDMVIGMVTAVISALASNLKLKISQITIVFTLGPNNEAILLSINPMFAVSSSRPQSSFTATSQRVSTTSASARQTAVRTGSPRSPTRFAVDSAGAAASPQPLKESADAESNFEGLSETSLKRILTASIHRRTEIPMSFADVVILVLQLQLSLPIPIVSSMWFEKDSEQWSLVFTDKEGMLHKKKVSVPYLKDKVLAKQKAKSTKTPGFDQICRLCLCPKSKDLKSLSIIPLDVNQSHAVVETADVTSVNQGIEGDIDGIKGFLQLIVDRGDAVFYHFNCDCLTPGATSSCVYFLSELESVPNITDAERLKASKALLESSNGVMIKAFAEVMIMSFNFQAKMLVKAFEVVFIQSKPDKLCIICMRCSCVSLEGLADVEGRGGLAGIEMDSYVSLSAADSSLSKDKLPFNEVADASVQSLQEPSATVEITAVETEITPKSPPKKVRPRPSFRERQPTLSSITNLLMREYQMAEIIYLIYSKEIPLKNCLMSIFATTDRNFILYFADGAGILRQKSNVDYNYVRNKITSLYEKLGAGTVGIDLCHSDGSSESIQLDECERVTSQQHFRENGSFLQIRSSDQRMCCEIKCQARGSSSQLTYDYYVRSPNGSRTKDDAVISDSIKQQIATLGTALVDQFSTKLQIKLSSLIIDFYPVDSSNVLISFLRFEAVESNSAPSNKPISAEVSKVAASDPSSESVKMKSTVAEDKADKVTPPTSGTATPQIRKTLLNRTSQAMMSGKDTDSETSTMDGDAARRSGRKSRPRPSMREKKPSGFSPVQVLDMVEIMYMLSIHEIDSGRCYMSVFPALDDEKFILYFAGGIGKIRQKSNVDYDYVNSKISALVSKSNTSEAVSIDLWHAGGVMEKVPVDKLRQTMLAPTFRRSGCYLQVRSSGDQLWTAVMNYNPTSRTHQIKCMRRNNDGTGVEDVVADSVEVIMTDVLENFVDKFRTVLALNLTKLTVAFYTTTLTNPTIAFMQFEHRPSPTMIGTLTEEANDSPGSKQVEDSATTGIVELWTSVDMHSAVFTLADILNCWSIHKGHIRCPLTVFATDLPSQFNMWIPGLSNSMDQKEGVSADYIIDKLKRVALSSSVLEVCSKTGERETLALDDMKDKLFEQKFVRKIAFFQLRALSSKRYWCKLRIRDGSVVIEAIFECAENNKTGKLIRLESIPNRAQEFISTNLQNVCEQFGSFNRVDLKETVVELLSDNAGDFIVGSIKLAGVADGAEAAVSVVPRPSTTSTTPVRSVRSAESMILQTITTANNSFRTAIVRPVEISTAQSSKSAVRTLTTGHLLALLCESEVKIGRCCMSIFAAATEDKFILFLTTAAEIVRQKISSCDFMMDQISKLISRLKNATPVISLCSLSGAARKVDLKDCRELLMAPTFKNEGQFLQVRLSEGTRCSCEVICATSGSTEITSIGYMKRLEDGTLQSIPLERLNDILTGAVQSNVRDTCEGIVTVLREQHSILLQIFILDFFVNEQQKATLAFFSGEYSEGGSGSLKPGGGVGAAAVRLADDVPFRSQLGSEKVLGAPQASPLKSSNKQKPGFDPTLTEFQMMDVLRAVSSTKMKLGKILMTVCAAPQDDKFVLYVASSENTIKQKTESLDYIVNRVATVCSSFAGTVTVDLCKNEAGIQNLKLNEFADVMKSPQFRSSKWFIQVRTVSSNRLVCYFDPNLRESKLFERKADGTKDRLDSTDETIRACTQELDSVIFTFAEEFAATCQLAADEIMVDFYYSIDGPQISQICIRRLSGPSAVEKFRAVVSSFIGNEEETAKYEFAAITGQGNTFGSIDQNMLVQFLVRLKFHVEDDHLAGLMAALDVDMDGKITCPDFLAFIFSQTKTVAATAESEASPAQSSSRATEKPRPSNVDGLNELNMRTLLALICEKSINASAFVMSVFAYDKDKFVLYLPANNSWITRYGSGDYMSKQIRKLVATIGETSVSICLHGKDSSIRVVNLQDSAAALQQLDPEDNGSYLILRPIRADIVNQRWSVMLSYSVSSRAAGPTRSCISCGRRADDGSLVLLSTQNMASSIADDVLGELYAVLDKSVTEVENCMQFTTGNLVVDFYTEYGAVPKISLLRALRDSPVKSAGNPAAPVQAKIAGEVPSKTPDKWSVNELKALSAKSEDASETDDSTLSSRKNKSKKAVLKARPSFKLNAPIAQSSEGEHLRHIEMGEMLHNISVYKLTCGRFFMSVFAAATASTEDFIMYLATESGIIKQKSVKLDFITRKIAGFCSSLDRTVTVRLFHSLGVNEFVPAKDCKDVLVRPQFKENGSYLQVQSTGDRKWTCQMTVSPPGSHNYQLTHCCQVVVDGNTDITISVSPSEAEVSAVKTVYSALIEEFSTKANIKIKLLRVDFWTDGSDFSNPMIAYMHSEFVEQATDNSSAAESSIVVASAPTEAKAEAKSVVPAAIVFSGKVQSSPSITDDYVLNKNTKPFLMADVLSLIYINQIPFSMCPMLIFPFETNTFAIYFTTENTLRRKTNVDVDYIMEKLKSVVSKAQNTEVCIEHCFDNGKNHHIALDACRDLMTGSQFREPGSYLQLRMFVGERLVHSTTTQSGTATSLRLRTKDGRLGEDVASSTDPALITQMSSVSTAILQGFQSKLKMHISTLFLDFSVKSRGSKESMMVVSHMYVELTLDNFMAGQKPITPIPLQMATPASIKIPEVKAPEITPTPSTSVAVTCPQQYDVNADAVFEKKYHSPKPVWFPLKQLSPYKLKSVPNSRSYYQRNIDFAEVLHILSVTKLSIAKLPVTVFCQNSNPLTEPRQFALFVTGGNNRLKIKVSADMAFVLKQLEAADTGASAGESRADPALPVGDLCSQDGSRHPLTLEACKALLTEDTFRDSGSCLQVRFYKSDRVLVCTYHCANPGSTIATIISFAQRFEDGTCKPLSFDDVPKLIPDAVETALRISLDRIVTEVKESLEINLQSIEVDFLSRVRDGKQELLFLFVKFVETVGIDDFASLESLCSSNNSVRNSGKQKSGKDSSLALESPREKAITEGSLQSVSDASLHSVELESNSCSIDDRVSNSESSDDNEGGGFKETRLSFRRLMLVAVKSKVSLGFRVVPTIFFIKDKPFNALIRSDPSTHCIERSGVNASFLDKFEDDSIDCEFRITNSKQFSSYMTKDSCKDLLGNKDSVKRRSFDYMQITHDASNRIDLVCKATILHRSSHTDSYADAEFKFVFGSRNCSSGVATFVTEQETQALVTEEIERKVKEAMHVIAHSFANNAKLFLSNLAIDFVVERHNGSDNVLLTCVTAAASGSHGSVSSIISSTISSRKSKKVTGGMPQTPKLAAINDASVEEDEASPSVSESPTARTGRKMSKRIANINTAEQRLYFSNVVSAMCNKKLSVPAGIEIPFTCVCTTLDGADPQLICYQSNSKGINRKRGVTIQQGLEKMMSTAGLRMPDVESLGDDTVVATHFSQFGKRTKLTAANIRQIVKSASGDPQGVALTVLRPDEYIQANYNNIDPQSEDVQWICELRAGGYDSSSTPAALAVATVVFGRLREDRTWDPVPDNGFDGTLTLATRQTVTQLCESIQKVLESKSSITCKRVTVEFDASATDNRVLRFSFASALIVGPQRDDHDGPPITAIINSNSNNSGGEEKHAENYYFKDISSRSTASNVSSSAAVGGLIGPVAMGASGKGGVTISAQKTSRVEFIDLLRSLSSKAVSVGPCLPVCLRFDSRAHSLQAFDSDSNNNIMLRRHVSTSALVDQLNNLMAKDGDRDSNRSVGFLYSLGGQRTAFNVKDCIKFLSGDMHQLNDKCSYFQIHFFPYNIANSYICLYNISANGGSMDGNDASVAVWKRREDVVTDNVVPVDLMNNPNAKTINGVVPVEDVAIVQRTKQVVELFVRNLREQLNLTVGCLVIEVCLTDPSYILYASVDLILNI